MARIGTSLLKGLKLTCMNESGPVLKLLTVRLFSESNWAKPATVLYFPTTGNCSTVVLHMAFIALAAPSICLRIELQTIL